MIIDNKEVKYLLNQMSRDALRQLAREGGVKIGKSRTDTIRNLFDSTKDLTFHLTIWAEWGK